MREWAQKRLHLAKDLEKERVSFSLKVKRTETEIFGKREKLFRKMVLIWIVIPNHFGLIH